MVDLANSGELPTLVDSSPLSQDDPGKAEVRLFKEGEQRRGLFSEEGLPVLTPPSETQLQTIAGNPQIEYYSPFRETEVVTPEETMAALAQGLDLGKYCFLTRVIPGLSQRMRTEFADKVRFNGQPLVGIRGIACSVDEDLVTDSGSFRCVRKIVRDGSETEGAETANIVYRNVASGESMHGYPVQYAIAYARRLRKALEASGTSNSIFPAILVYDLSRMAEGPGGYAEGLPESPEERAQVIMRVYVLDYPET